MRVLQISDLHIVPNVGERIYGVDSYLSLERVLSQARDADPELIIVTGDLAERGDEPSYQRLRELLRSTGMPVLVLPGNHDSLRRMATSLYDDCISFPRTFDMGVWRFVLLNSRVRGAAHGQVASEDRRELDKLLSEAVERPSVIALHHTPISPCPSFGCQLVGAGSFLDQLAEHSNVRAVIAGHSHIEADANYRGIRIVTTPSTCAEARHSVAGECRDLEDFWSSHSFDQSRHGYRLLDLSADGSLDTRVCWVSNSTAA